MSHFASGMILGISLGTFAGVATWYSTHNVWLEGTVSFVVAFVVCYWVVGHGE